MSEAYDMLLSQRHEAALERKIEAQAAEIERLKDAIRYALNQLDCIAVNAIEQRLQDALEE